MGTASLDQCRWCHRSEPPLNRESQSRQRPEAADDNVTLALVVSPDRISTSFLDTIPATWRCEAGIILLDGEVPYQIQQSTPTDQLVSRLQPSRRQHLHAPAPSRGREAGSLESLGDSRTATTPPRDTGRQFRVSAGQLASGIWEVSISAALSECAGTPHHVLNLDAEAAKPRRSDSCWRSNPFTLHYNHPRDGQSAVAC